MSLWLNWLPQLPPTLLATMLLVNGFDRLPGKFTFICVDMMPPPMPAEVAVLPVMVEKVAHDAVPLVAFTPMPPPCAALLPEIVVFSSRRLPPVADSVSR